MVTGVSVTVDETNESNPWQSALEDQLDQEFRPLSHGNDGDPNHRDNQSADEDIPCTYRLSMAFMKTSIVCDILFGILLVVDALMLRKGGGGHGDTGSSFDIASNNPNSLQNQEDHGHDSRTDRDGTVIPCLILLFPAAILCIRWPLALFSIYYTDSCNRCGVHYSALTSAVLSIYYLVLALVVVLIDHAKVLNFIDHTIWALERGKDREQSDTAATIWISHQHYYVVWSALLFLAVWECTRYHVFRFHHQRLLRSDTTILLNDSREGEGQRGRKPWWWQASHKGHGHHYDFSNDDLRQELLERHTNDATGLPDWVTEGRRDYHQDSGLSPNRGQIESQRPRWLPSWLSPSPRRTGRRGENISAVMDIRDETNSVDFASVQEEWASRTEEDPFWWSREEEQGAGCNGNQFLRDPFDADDEGDSDDQATNRRARARRRSG